MKPHELGYELNRPEMRLLLANSILGDVRVTGLLKTFDLASDATRRASARSRLFTKLGEAHLSAIHEASPELAMVREERAPILARKSDVHPLDRRPEVMSVIIGPRTLAWALDGIRPYLGTQEQDASLYVVNPEQMKSFVDEYDRLESAKERSKIVAGTELGTAS